MPNKLIALKADGSLPSAVVTAINALIAAGITAKANASDVATSLLAKADLVSGKVPASQSQVASVATKTGAVTLVAADISDSTAVGRSVLMAADAAAARAAIGAGTGSGGGSGLADLADSTVSAAGQLAAGVTSNVVAGAYTSPALDVAVATPPKRFAIKGPSTGTATLTLPDPAGVSRTVTLLPDEVLTLRQKTTSGWGAESGNKPLAQLDLRFTPTGRTPGVWIPRGSLDRWKTQRDLAKAGSILGEVVCYGDSTTWGQTSTSNAATGVGRDPLPQKLRALAVAAGFPDGGMGIAGGLASASASGADNLALISASTGTWTETAAFYSPLRAYGLKNSSNTAGDSLTIQMKIPTGGGKIRIVHTAGSFANCAQWSYAVDGGAATAATVQTTTRKTRTVTTGALAAGTHTVTITITTPGAAAGGDEWLFEAVGNSGLVFQDYGISGAKASTRFDISGGYAQEAYALGYYEDVAMTVNQTTPWLLSTGRAGTTRNPVLALHHFGLNDLLNGAAAFASSTAANDMAGLVAASVGAFAEITKPVCDAIVCIPHFSWITTNAQWVGVIRAALFAAAEAYSLPVADLQQPLGFARTNYTTYGGGIHLNSAGYAAQTQFLWDNFLNAA